MSTRGTYTVKTKVWNGKIDTKHFYIHCDNYPEGAAFKMRQLVEFDGRGSAVERFIRALPNAEFTTSPESHGDTDYHYDIDGETWEITCLKHKRDWDDHENDTKEMVFSGLLVDFIAKYEDPAWYDEKPSPCIMHGSYPTTRKALEKLYNAKMAQALLWTAKGHTGNASSTATEAYKINEILNPGKTILPEFVFLAGIYVKSYRWKNSTAQDYIDRIWLGKSK